MMPKHFMLLSNRKQVISFDNIVDKNKNKNLTPLYCDKQFRGAFYLSVK